MVPAAAAFGGQRAAAAERLCLAVFMASRSGLVTEKVSEQAVLLFGV